MARDVKQVEIAGKTYLLTMLTPERGLEIFMELFKIAGPALATAGDKGMDAALEGDFLGKVIRALAMNLSKESTMPIVHALLDKTEKIEKNRKVKVSLNVDFAGGQYKALLMLLKEQITFQFQDFFSGFGDLNGILSGTPPHPQE